MKLSKKHIDLLQQAADLADGREYSPEGRFVYHITDDKAGVLWLAKRGYLERCRGGYEITGKGCDALMESKR